MKKKQRCLLKRFAALVAVIVISLSLPVSALAASDTEADMPSTSDFDSHYGSWFVWRVRYAGGITYYELTSSPISFDSSGAVDFGSPANFTPTLFDVNLLSGSSNYGFACSYPVPFSGVTGKWSELPSFPVGRAATYSHALVSLYCPSSCASDIPSYACFLSPSYSSSDRLSSYSTSSGSQADSFTPAVFPSPFYSYPFAFRVTDDNNVRSYVVQGGNSDCINFSSPSISLPSSSSLLSFASTRFLAGTSSFSVPSFGYSCPSSNLGLVVVNTSVVGSGGLITSASQFSFSSIPTLTPTLLVPVGMLPDVKVGDWLSDSPEDLQKAITNEFGIDSGTLKNSKDNLNSWNSTSSVDSDVASGASGLLGGLFQNLGTFLFSVSLLCFGAVVLRMLIRKAVDG